jgi:hypothetical protein
MSTHMERERRREREREKEKFLDMLKSCLEIDPSSAALV